jgi:3-oxoacyl-[acyl-carrier protein] reductase
MEKMEAPVALITGGSRGLGFETAKALRAQGFEVILLAKDAERLQSAANELSAATELSAAKAITTYAVDFENPTATSDALEKIALVSSPHHTSRSCPRCNE